MDWDAHYLAGHGEQDRNRARALSITTAALTFGHLLPRWTRSFRQFLQNHYQIMETPGGSLSEPQ